MKTHAGGADHHQSSDELPDAPRQPQAAAPDAGLCMNALRRAIRPVLIVPDSIKPGARADQPRLELQIVIIEGDDFSARHFRRPPQQRPDQ